MWTTDPVFMKIGTEYFYYQSDHLGTPQMLTDQTGAIVWSADYGSFGEASISIAAEENNLRFPGQYYDAETGLHYNWHRYYDPEVGRYLQNDPIGFAGGINFYLYVGANSLRFVDPYGLSYVNPPPVFWFPIPGVNRPLPGYNYCGPGNYSGRGPNPGLDVACEAHDKCYGTSGFDAGDVSVFNPGQGSGPSDQDTCDDNLCDAANQSGEWIAPGVRGIFCDPKPPGKPPCPSIPK